MRGSRRAHAATALALAALGAAVSLDGREGATSRAAAPPVFATAATAGVSNAVRPARVKGYPGRALVCTARRRDCRRLTSTPVAIGAVIDARRGAVSLATRRADGTAARMKAWGEFFKLEQGRGADAVLVARLMGGGFSATCGAARSSTVVRKLFGDGEGAFRMIGRYATATTLSGAVQVSDRCGSTMVRVTRGSADVADLERQVTRTLGAGATYLAAPPAAKPVPPGRPGIDNAVRPASVPGYRGPVTVCNRLGRDCRTLTAETLVAIGSYVDTTKGAVSLETGPPQSPGGGAAGGLVRAAPARPRITVYAGVVQLLQAKSPGAVLRARLAGGSFTSACRPARSARAALDGIVLRSPRYPTRRVRRVRATGDGPFQVDGRDGRAITTGTTLQVADRCDGTLVEVTQGAVIVSDPRRHTSKTLSAPGRTLVRRPG